MAENLCIKYGGGTKKLKVLSGTTTANVNTTVQIDGKLKHFTYYQIENGWKYGYVLLNYGTAEQLEWYTLNGFKITINGNEITMPRTGNTEYTRYWYAYYE